jgi:hypothetical protein
MLALSLAAPDPARLLAADLFGMEVIRDTLPVSVPDARPNWAAVIRDPRPGEQFPAMRVILSRSRYWQQDRHLDVVVRLQAPAGIELRSTRMRGTISEVAGRRLSQFDLASVPGVQFVLYPRFPAGFLGLSQMELTWLADDRVIELPRRDLRRSGSGADGDRGRPGPGGQALADHIGQLRNGGFPPRP